MGPGKDEQDVIETLLQKLRARDEVGPEEEEALRKAIGDVREFPSDRTIIREGELLDNSTLLLEGLMLRYKDLRDGGRQVSAVHIAGDFLDLHSFTLKRLDHNILTATPCKVALAPHKALREITERFPHLTRLLWFSTNLDAAMHREWELSLGRRSAMGRTAHLLCELHTRLEVVGLADSEGFALALTQTEFAECVGLTPVHVNRTLRKLREEGLVDFRGGRVTMLDRAKLEAVAEFKRDYLYLDPYPR